jgi:hypothetical protein
MYLRVEEAFRFPVPGGRTVALNCLIEKALANRGQVPTNELLSVC